MQFDDCIVPVENLLGEKGRGFSYAMAALDGGRLMEAARCTASPGAWCGTRATVTHALTAAVSSTAGDGATMSVRRTGAGVSACAARQSSRPVGLVARCAGARGEAPERVMPIPALCLPYCTTIEGFVSVCTWIAVSDTL